jgi:hypothetical protein
VVIPLGIAMGIIVNVMIFVTDMNLAMALMVLIGALSGFFVVPMNALLQHRGHILMGAGHSIAVQNFNENLSILIMTGLYALLIHSILDQHGGHRLRAVRCRRHVHGQTPSRGQPAGVRLRRHPRRQPPLNRRGAAPLPLHRATRYSVPSSSRWASAWRYMSSTLARPVFWRIAVW